MCAARDNARRQGGCYAASNSIQTTLIQRVLPDEKAPSHRWHNWSNTKTIQRQGSKNPAESKTIEIFQCKKNRKICVSPKGQALPHAPATLQPHTGLHTFFRHISRSCTIDAFKVQVSHPARSAILCTSPCHHHTRLLTWKRKSHSCQKKVLT
jgi:hypothetical protein